MHGNTFDAKLNPPLVELELGLLHSNDDDIRVPRGRDVFRSLRGRSTSRPVGNGDTRQDIAPRTALTLDCLPLMPTRGKFIAIEGIDGSGKRTQLDLLARALESRGVDCAQFSFPRYESSFGRLVAQYLNGDFGPLAAVDAHLSALLYAGDRFESKAELEAALNAGKTVLADRYIASNLAHQTARVGPQRRAEFLAWLRKLEYGLYGLPAEDLVIYLRLPVSEAQRLVGMKEAREYTSKQRDLQEADQKHLEQAALVYESLAMEPNWVTVNCAEGKVLMSVEKIHAAVMAAVDLRVKGLGKSGSRG